MHFWWWLLADNRLLERTWVAFVERHLIEDIHLGIPESQISPAVCQAGEDYWSYTSS
jgi:hypothetical protein